MNSSSKNTVFHRTVVAGHCDMRFMKIILESMFYTSLNVVVHYICFACPCLGCYRKSVSVNRDFKVSYKYPVVQGT